MLSPFKMTVEELSNYLIIKNKKLRALMEKKLELELDSAILTKKEELKQKKMPPSVKEERPVRKPEKF